MKVRRHPLLTGFTAAACMLVGLVVIPSAPARATTGATVRLVSHRVATTRGSVSTDRTVVTAVTGVSTAVSRRIAADLNARTQLFITPPKGVPGPFNIVDVVRLSHADGHYITVDQDTYHYSGGAHGSSAHRPVTYTRGTASLVTLHTFAAANKEPALLRALSARTRKTLAARGIDQQFYTDGTAPTYQNFADFQPLPTGWLVEFAQSAAASHAQGPIKVLVPWSALSGLIRPPLPT